ncbi:acyltransferase family protein [Demequina capsici]|uniref:Acyltransferase family protein n=1 Tax=Demequina capsici TaxID=3075620 RepID=A0AA96F513_9MICO|nr:acyltransferase family protein [Demequina sp. OYTSA14]WNM23243.1 acyltransferase family protein [Demequina sp. OYTSA14]
MTTVDVRDHAPTRTATVLRPEIQALRALAVLGVVLFHLWPGRLTGGYAGVDVFFVISGFLITAHLTKEITATGRLSLTQFWARRIRRLLPAALTVLALTAAATYMWVPRSLWSTHLWQVIASATYWQNFRLTAEAVDYLGAENLPSSVEHFWSLSVEEQFYILWPLLIVAGLAMARRRHRTAERTLILVLAAILVAGLATSIVLTATSPAAAYFVTPTRVWEFAVGGLIALLPLTPARLSDKTRTAISLVGWSAIVLTFVFYTPATPFPGWTALVPVVGTAAVIWSGAFANGPLAWVVERRAVQYTGALSYSLYLTHWPLIVIAPFALGGHRSFVGNVAILVASFVLAAVLRRTIEEPIRRLPYLQLRPGVTYASAAAAMIAVMAIAFVGIWVATESHARSERLAQSLASDPAGCLGAASILGAEHPCVNPELDGVLLPDPAALLDDTGGAYSCYDDHPDGNLEVCHFGSTRTDALRVALVGNSHAAALLPGLQDNAARANWSLDTYLAFQCTWRAISPDDEVCQDHRAALQSTIEAQHYDVVLVAELRTTEIMAGDPNPSAALHAEAWAPVLAEGTEIIAVADNPILSQHEVDCVGASLSIEEAQRCGAPREVALATSDPLPEAVRLAGDGAHLIDYTDLYCDAQTCPAVIGHVIVYRDKHHLTATFSRTLGPFLIDDVDRILESSPQRSAPAAS